MSEIRTMTRMAGLVTAVAAIVLVAACGGGSAGPGVAQIKSSTPAASGSTSSAAAQPSAVAYAKCMRSHGVPNYPDPSKGGKVEGKVNFDTPQFRAAQEACKALLPAGGSLNTGGGKLSPELQAQLLKFARCMRAHGIKNFKDPTSSGLSPGDGVNPDSPQFKAATKACQSLLPNNGNGPVSTQGGGS